MYYKIFGEHGDLCAKCETKDDVYNWLNEWAPDMSADHRLTYEVELAKSESNPTMWIDGIEFRTASLDYLNEDEFCDDEWSEALATMFTSLLNQGMHELDELRPGTRDAFEKVVYCLGYEICIE